MTLEQLLPICYLFPDQEAAKAQQSGSKSCARANSARALLVEWSSSRLENDVLIGRIHLFG